MRRCASVSPPCGRRSEARPMSSVDGVGRGRSPVVDVSSEAGDVGRQENRESRAGSVPPAGSDTLPVGTMAEAQPEIPAPLQRSRMEGSTLLLEEADDDAPPQ